MCALCSQGSPVFSFLYLTSFKVLDWVWCLGWSISTTLTFFKAIGLVNLPCGSLGAICEWLLKIFFCCVLSSKGAQNFRKMCDVLFIIFMVIMLFDISVLYYWTYLLIIYLSSWYCYAFPSAWYVLLLLSLLEVREDIKE